MLMQNDTERAIAQLLTETGAAHGVYETNALGGVYDDAWPVWYAGYLVAHGIGDLLGRPIAADALSTILTQCQVEHEREHAAEAWPTYYARRIAVLGR